MRLSAAQAKTRRRLVGLVFLLVFALLVWLSVALYNKQFTPAANVTLYTDSVGNEMHPGADVMIRGVLVGEVRQISADGTGARLELAIQPDMVSQIPANVTAVMVPEGHDADAFRNLALDHFNISYGMSFGRFAGKMFRIGHLGDTNDATIVGALAATEMALALAGIPHRKGGVQAAMDYLVSVHARPARAAAE